MFFLGAFSRLRRATIRLVVSVRPSVWNDATQTGRNFMKCCTWVFFEHLSRKFKFQEYLTRKASTLHEYRCTFMIIYTYVYTACLFSYYQLRIFLLYMINIQNYTDRLVRIWPNFANVFRTTWKVLAGLLQSYRVQRQFCSRWGHRLPYDRNLYSLMSTENVSWLCERYNIQPEDGSKGSSRKVEDFRHAS